MTGDRACLVCGTGAPFRPLYARDGFTLVRCPSCGLVFQDPRPTDEDLERTYYHDPSWTKLQVGALHDKLVERARSQLAMLERAGVPANGERLLDVGCAAGVFMTCAKQAGWRPVGIELGAPSAEEARSRGLDVHTGTLSDAFAALEPGGFALVTFWDVLEHVRDPDRELALAHRLLRPGGTLAATMPNVAGLYPRCTYRLIARPTGRWEYPELPVHLHDFDPRTIRRLLFDAGFRDVRVRTFATPFFYYRWNSLSLAALGGRVRGRALRAAFEALRPVLYPLARLTDRGNSQFVVATRP